MLSLSFYFLVGLVVLLIPVLLLLVRLHEGAAPSLSLADELARLGLSGEISVQAADEGRGLRQITVLLRQEQREIELLKRNFPRRSLISQAGPESFAEVITVAPKTLELRDGRAELVLRALEHSWRNWLVGNRSETLIPPRGRSGLDAPGRN